MNNSQWSVIFHLSGFAGHFAPGIANWAVPLVLWLIKRTDDPELDRVGKEVVNFQISYTVYTLVLGAIIGALVFLLIGFFLIPLLFLLWLAWIIFMIVAAVKASSGEFYRYPYIIRFLS